MSEHIRKKPFPEWLKWIFVIIAVYLAISGVLMIRQQRSEDNTPAETFYTCDELPGGYTPELLVNGKCYKWAGLSLELTNTDKPGLQVISNADGLATTYLPDGFVPYGQILEVIDSPPAEDRQLQAGFSASGMIYTNPQMPETVYVYMTTDWFSETYIRFISPALGNNQLIAWKGQLYAYPVNSTSAEILTELPQEFQSAGTLHYIGENIIPQENLQANCSSDSYGFTLEDREIFYDPQDHGYIYLRQQKYWLGDWPVEYIKCPLWSE